MSKVSASVQFIEIAREHLARPKETPQVKSKLDLWRWCANCMDRTHHIPTRFGWKCVECGNTHP